MLNYIQDKENTIDNTISEMLKDVTASYKPKNQAKSGSEFSNIINNLSSKTEKTQTNFVDKVAKSNTSSINRAVFDKNSNDNTNKNTVSNNKNNKPNNNKTVKQASFDSKDDLKEKAVKKVKNQNKTYSKQDNSQEDGTESNSIKLSKEDSLSETNKVQKDTNSDNISKNEVKDTDLKKTDIQKLSDVEYNSIVESSPLSLKEENIDDNDVQVSVNSDEIIAEASALLTLNSNETSTVSKDENLEKLSFELLQSEDIESKIEEITATFDEYNLSKENKEDIKEAFNKIKEIKLNADNADSTVQFEFKEEIKEILSKLSENIKVDEIGNDTSNSSDLTNVSDNNNLKNNSEISVFDTKEEKSLVSADYSKEFKKPETVDFEDYSNDKIALNDDNQIENKDVELNQKETLNVKPIVFDDEKATENQNIIEYDDEINSDNEKPDLKEKITVIQNNNEDKADIKVDNKEPLSDVQTTAVKTDNGESLIKNNDALEENVQEVSKIAVNSSDNLNNQTSNNSKENDKQSSDDKAVLNKISNQNTNVEEDDFEVSEDNIKPTKLYAKVEQSSDVEENEPLEENLEKLAFEQEKLDKILVSMSKQTVNNATLTVSDEVAKIAINEDVSINSAVNVVYDSAGDNILLKNMQTMRPVDNIFNELQSKLENSNILNQITEKFEQIKNTINQKFTMVLRPNDLGRLSIELTSGLKGLITNIIVQNDNVRSFIEKNINSLRNQLASAGVNVNQIQIKTAGTGETTTYSGNQENQNQQQEEAFKQNGNNNKEQNKKQYLGNDSLLASLSTFDTSFADDFSSVLNKTISYGLN